MLQIIELIESPLKDKKYRAIINDGSHYDFGLKGSKTYLDHQNSYLRCYCSPNTIWESRKLCSRFATRKKNLRFQFSAPHTLYLRIKRKESNGSKTTSKHVVNQQNTKKSDSLVVIKFFNEYRQLCSDLLKCRLGNSSL